MITRSGAGRLLILALTVVLLAGCGSSLPQPAEDMERRQQQLEDLVVTLDARRAPQTLQEQPFQIFLSDPAGRPVDNAEVYLDMEMEMLCLSGAMPVAEPRGGGRYEALSLYQMAGEWQVTVIARLPAGERRATFLIPVAEAP